MRKLTVYGPSIIVLFTAIVVLFAGPSAVKRLTYAQDKARIVQANTRLDGGGNILEAMNQAFRDIAEAVEPSVVHISAIQQGQDGWGRIAVSSGSGWIYDDRGHIVTNHHVIEQADRIEVQLHNGVLRDAEVVGYDQFTDIAVIKIDPELIHPSRLAPPENSVRQGDIVFAFGSPFDFRFSMSQGVVSGKGRSVGVIRNRRGQQVGYENFIQVDAAINPGNSGGPLTDIRGQVIGMNTAIATGGNRSSRSEEGQFAGIGLAIPLEMIVPVVDQLIETGIVHKGYLGVSFDNLTARTRDRLSRQGFEGRGILVTRVDEEGPADRAGLQPGDIITRVNEEAVENGNQLRSVISSQLPGEETKIEFWRYDQKSRKGSSQSTTVVLGLLPTLRVMGTLPDDHAEDSLIEVGIQKMSTATKELAKEYGVEYRSGILVEQLVKGSWLDSVLDAGSIIDSVNGESVQTATVFLEKLQQYDLRPFSSGARVTAIRADGEKVSLVLRAGASP